MSDAVKVTFEFFPPSDDDMAAHLWAAIQRLAPLQPKFVSVTYGADGSTRSKTHECVLRILRETDLLVAPHLTCVGASREEVIAIAQDYWGHGVRHMVALRGDAPGAGASGQGIKRKIHFGAIVAGSSMQEFESSPMSRRVFRPT